jgi:hypothetical protein
MRVSPPFDATVAAPLTLGRKAGLGLTWACGLAVLVGLLAVGMQMRLYLFAGQSAQQDVAARMAASDLAVSVVRCRRYEQDLLRNLADPQAFQVAQERWSRSWGDLCGALDQLQASARSAADREQAASYLATARDYGENLRKLTDAVRQGRITGRDDAERTLAWHQRDSRPAIAAAVVFARHKIDADAQAEANLAASACFSLILTGALTLWPAGLMLAGMIWLRAAPRGVARRGMVSSSGRAAADRRFADADVLDRRSRGGADTPQTAAADSGEVQTSHPDDFAEIRLLDSLRTIADEVAGQTQPAEQRAAPTESPSLLSSDTPVAR